MIKKELEEKFIQSFQTEPTDLLRCGGRFEVLGNHTDHNHGLCVAATCDMSIFAAVSQREDKIVNVISEGYDDFNLDLAKLSKVDSEVGTSKGLIRGVAHYLKNNHYHIGGFNCYLKSTIFKGAGVSSSAAFEMLMGKIFSILFNQDKIDRITLAKAGQYAENKYYEKSCGLLDQIGVSFGNMVSIDFDKMDKIKVNSIEVDLKGYCFYLVNTGGDHSKMSHLYSKIPLDMFSAAKKLGVDYLRQSSLEQLEKNKDLLTEAEYHRALHFFNENERVKKFIKNKNVETLISCINLSRLSSTMDLKNMMGESYEGSPLEACDLVMKLTDNKGACKINGGGFAGSIVCLIPNEDENTFKRTMKQKYGTENVYKVNIDPVGFGHF